MSTRPTLNDFRSNSHHHMASNHASQRGLPSSRITHLDGDIAKTLSPLAALQAHTERLAKQLNDGTNNGRRVSRLDPLAIASSLPPGPDYPKSMPAELEEANPPTGEDEGSGNTPEVEEPLFRPQSQYIRVSGMGIWDVPDFPSRPTPDEQNFATPAEFRPMPNHDYFSAVRSRSPEPLQSARKDVEEVTNHLNRLYPQHNLDAARRREPSPRSQQTEFATHRGYDTSALAPPMPSPFRPGGSIRSVPVDSSDDDLSASTGGSSFSQQRKLSSCSGVSMPQSPLPHPHGRSPSLNSEYSIGGSPLARPVFSNFSRPLSRASRPSGEAVSRQPSFDSRPSLDSRSRQPSYDNHPPRGLTDDSIKSSLSVDRDHFYEAKEHQNAPALSYIYAKFSLPRGRMLLRDSNGGEHGPVHKFDWEPAPVRSNVIPANPAVEYDPFSPTPSPPSSSQSNIDTPKPSQRPSAEQTRSTSDRPPPTPLADDKLHHSSASMRSGSTIKARSNRTILPTLELNAEEHLAKGIELHERGSLSESTYHLRIAAKANLPTAMLLYALACRHGWGMRSNQHEGVAWLRRAADSASLEIADDEDHSKDKDGLPNDALGRKTRRAQFALSIYELGVSHMNGWGIEQDKALALRCFEIAGNWGDPDAMAEAGFCYAQGTGCKKDLKKAAKYYRMAEAKGISMVGNSWYVQSLCVDCLSPQADRSES